ncbi:T-complex protein 1 subunit theta [Colletotrichum sp. SAR11_239]|nr:T-complex protein 1 subunit theta [Colletotrichum sp. SAR11_239]
MVQHCLLHTAKEMMDCTKSKKSQSEAFIKTPNGVGVSLEFVNFKNHQPLVSREEQGKIVAMKKKIAAQEEKEFSRAWCCQIAARGVFWPTGSPTLESMQSMLSTRFSGL